MTTREPHIVYYAESFCGLSETYVYRTAKCLSSILPTTILTHERKHREAFPDDALHIWVEPRTLGRARRVVDLLRTWLVCGILDSHSLRSELLARIVGRQQEGVVYAQFGLAGVRALSAADALGWPLIVNFHGCDVTTWLAFRGYARNLKRLFSSPRAMFLVPSHYIAAEVAALGAPEARTTVYYNPIPIPESLPRPRDEDAPFIFLHAGRLVPVKGITYTLRSFAKIAFLHDCRLRIIGAGSEEQTAVSLASELGVADKVTFLGAVDHSAVQREMAGADVFVQHSVIDERNETEGLPVAICEAMAHGLPVISTRHAGIPEVVDDGVTGMLVGEKDVDGMAAAFHRLITRPDLRKQYAEQGRKAVEQRFSMDAARLQLQQLLNEAMS